MPPLSLQRLAGPDRPEGPPQCHVVRARRPPQLPVSEKGQTVLDPLVDKYSIHE